MKKLLQMKFMLLLCALIVGSGTMWADDTYKRITSTDDLSVGSEYIIVSETNNVAMGTISSDKGQGIAVTISNSSITLSSTSTVNVFTLGGTSTGYTLLGSQDSKYVGYNSGTKLVANAQASTNSYKWTITFSGNNAFIANVATTSRYIRGYDNNKDFRAYGTTNGSVVQLYKKEAASTSPLASIALSGTYPTQFFYGDDFSHEGMTVTATYEDNTTKDVTNSATFSGYSKTSYGEQEITVSYSEGEITKEAKYDIIIPTLNSISISGSYPTTFTEGDEFSHEGMVVTANYIDGDNNEYSRDVTEKTNYLFFWGYDISVPAVQNVTVAYYEGETFKTAEYTITVNAIPEHSVVWIVNGSINSQQYKEGATVIFPTDPAAIGDKVFVGWTTTPIEGITDIAPTFVTSATMGDADIFLYAVFALKTETTGEITKTYGFETESDADWTINGPVRTAEEAKTGEYSGKINTNNTYVTFNNKVKVKEFSFAFKRTSNNNNYNVSVETSEDNSNWKAAATYPMSDFGNGTYTTKNKTFDGTSELYVRFHCNQTTAVRYVDDVTIKYDASSTNYSGYCTTVGEDTRTDPEFSFNNASETVELYNASQYTGQTLNRNNSPLITPITWTSSDETVATVNEEGKVTILAEGTTVIKASFAGNPYIKNGEASYTLTVVDNRQTATIEFRDNGTAITQLNLEKGEAREGITIFTDVPGLEFTDNSQLRQVWGNNETHDNKQGAIPAHYYMTFNTMQGLALGTMTFYAEFPGNENYKPATAALTVTVTGGGTESFPYSVAEARAAIDKGTGTEDVYVTGVVCKVTSTEVPSNGELTYWISDDGSDTNALQVYKGKSYNGDAFTSLDDIQVDDEVTVYGTLSKYNTTYQFNAGNQLTALRHLEKVYVDDINVDGRAQHYNAQVTCKNFEPKEFTAYLCDQYGYPTEYDWVSYVTSWIDPEVSSVVRFYFEKNEGDAPRTAYAVIKAKNEEGNDIYSKMITITQAKYVPDYATLPFEFDRGKDDIESTSGLTQNGLGTDYSSKPKLKFDNTGDYLVLKIDEAPGKLTFDIEGHSFSGGTFKVQTSADGETFTDLASYTDLGNNKISEEFDDLDTDVRYIKWIYTQKSSGNVGLGNINLAKLSTDPVIKLAETSVEVDAKQHDGTIALTYKNLQIDSMDDFDVQFYSDEQGTVTADAPEWVEALVAAQDPNVGPGYVLSYVINANDGAARTAYLRVYANDGVNSVASDVVTITQAKFVKTTTYTLAHAITPGKHYVIASGGVGTVYVMGKQKSTNRDVVSGAEVNFSEVLSVTEDIAADVREFIISKDGNYYTIFDESESGYLFASSMSDNHLKTQATNNANGQWTITIDEEGVATLKANMTGRNWMRFNKNSEVFSCYGENSNQQDIYLFEKDNDEGSLVIPIAAACTDGTNCFGTFSSTKPFVVPENLTVSEIGIDTDGTMNVVNYDAGAVVPANTGVMVSAAVGDRSYVANVSTEVGNNVLNGDNRLRPTGDNGLTATEMNSAEPETCKFYRLTMHDGTKLGFWWGADGGDSFAIVANKAYLAVPASVAGARNGFAFGDDATGISNVNVNENVNGSVFDLQGRKVSTPGKGLYIVNGKKVVIK